MALSQALFSFDYAKHENEIPDPEGRGKYPRPMPFVAAIET
jgi:hypothetical protein